MKFTLETIKNEYGFYETSIFNETGAFIEKVTCDTRQESLNKANKLIVDIEAEEELRRSEEFNFEILINLKNYKIDKNTNNDYLLIGKDGNEEIVGYYLINNTMSFERNNSFNYDECISSKSFFKMPSVDSSICLTVEGNYYKSDLITEKAKAIYSRINNIFNENEQLE